MTRLELLYKNFSKDNKKDWNRKMFRNRAKQERDDKCLALPKMIEKNGEKIRVIRNILYKSGLFNYYLLSNYNILFMALFEKLTEQ